VPTEFRLRFAVGEVCMAKNAWFIYLASGAILGMLVLAACGTSTGTSPALTPSTSVASLSPGELPLPTPPFVNNPPDICAGVGISALLRGDAHDPVLTWVEDTTTHTRRDVVWPVGYRARFTPRLQVLDASGAVVLRESDLIAGTCGSTADGRFYLAPPFR
jgi:hypothetical protein